jgi:hypothetical protein
LNWMIVELAAVQTKAPHAAGWPECGA